MLTSEDLVALIIRAQEGDRTSLTPLMRELEGRLLPYLRCCLHRKGIDDLATAEVLVQETLLRFLKKLSDWKREKDSSGMAWVLTIATRLLISFLRERRKEFAVDFLPDRPDGGDPPPDAAIRAEATRLLQEALDSLPPEVAAILRGHFFHGRPLTSLLRERGLEYHAFYHNDYQRALNHLRGRLARLFPERADA